MKALIAVFLLIGSVATAKDKASFDGYIYHSTCQGHVRADRNSKHKYVSKLTRGLFVTGYCVVTL